jgi:hypothetical protein
MSTVTENRVLRLMFGSTSEVNYVIMIFVIVLFTNIKSRRIRCELQVTVPYILLQEARRERRGMQN